jgi:ribosomal protein L29
VNWLITEPNLGALPPVQQHRLVGLLMAPPPDGDYPAFRAYLADAQRDPRLGTMGRRMLAYGMETQETTNRLYRDLGAIDGAKNHWHGQSERAEADASRWRVQAEELRAELAHLRGQTIVPEARFSRMRTSWVYRQVAKVYSRYYRS